VLTNVNALGEMTVSQFDALGRVTQSEIFSASGSLVRQTSMNYSPDFNSVTVTSGSGALPSAPPAIPTMTGTTF